MCPILPARLQVWPVDAPAMTTVPCGGNLTLTLEGRNAVVLSVAPLPAAAAAAPLLLGRAARRLNPEDAPPALVSSAAGTGFTLRIPASSARDTAPPQGMRLCASSKRSVSPLYVLVPEAAASLLSSVEDSASGAKLRWSWATWEEHTGAVDAADGCWVQPRSFSPAPFAPAGTRLVRIDASSQTAATFVHNQPVSGMGYNPAFTGGVLSGTVRVPAAVFTQVRAREASPHSHSHTYKLHAPRCS